MKVSAVGDVILGSYLSTSSTILAPDKRGEDDCNPIGLSPRHVVDAESGDGFPGAHEPETAGVGPMRITTDDLRRGCKAFQEREYRDAMYKISQELIEHHWGNAEETADALGVLLLTWNHAAYRYDRFDYTQLQAFLETHAAVLNDWRSMRLEGLAVLDASAVGRIFDALLDALVTVKGSRSPVGAGKALHLLAPRMFPLWDNKIARHYGCGFMGAPGSAAKYARFTQRMKDVLNGLDAEMTLAQLEGELNAQSRFPKPILKFIDEYNYARFTYKWIT